MLVLNDWKSFPPHLRGGVLCVGNFDGVHRGHAQMLATGRDEAKKRGIPFTIMTFDPHPILLLRPNAKRPPLTTVEQRLTLLEQFSPDVILMIQTTPEFLALSAEEFLQTIVRGNDQAGIGATLIVEGPSFTYGKQAKGTVKTLQESGPALGLQTIIVPTQETMLTDLTMVKISSSLIRWFVENGRVADAASALGRPYTLRGIVVEGAKRGRAIGFPTANLQSFQLTPAAGVYAGAVTVDGSTHTAAISVGTNPTFHGQNTTVEAFLLDFSGDLYGKTLDLAFHKWVREMYAFAGVDPLVTQMHRDVALTRQLMQSPVDPSHKESA
jgi:riboflavin kinase/FMN adenylyltransferase